MKFPKPKRIVNKKLLESYHSMPCLVCKTTIGVVAHHLKTRGSGGHDIAENLIPLCCKHHQEIHKLGEYTFRLKYNL